MFYRSCAALGQIDYCDLLLLTQCGLIWFNHISVFR